MQSRKYHGLCTAFITKRTFQHQYRTDQCRLSKYNGSSNVAHQKTMLDAAQKLARHFEHQHHAMKTKNALFMISLLDKSCTKLHDNIHWTQEELDDQLKNFSRITYALHMD